MTEHLYTQADIKRVRDEFAKKQNGIDPVLKEAFKEMQVLDHDHVSQHVRAALNRNTNAFEGLVFNAYRRCLQWLTDKPLPEILRNLAEYLEQDYSSNPYHPNFMKVLQTRFNSLPEGSKKTILAILGQDEGRNALERKKLFKSVLMKRRYGYEELLDMIEKEKANAN